MLSNTLKIIVEAAVCTELIDAKRTHGDHYASPHEGYGVLMEELHEAANELQELSSFIHGQLLEGLHGNNMHAMICDLATVDQLAKHLACEAIQVGAVARKFSETLADTLEEAHG